jgi:Tfp pilus assembly protein PilE
MNKYRLPAFTILELTVAMLLSAIVIGITYTSFTIVSKSYSGFTERNNEMAVLIRLDELLQRDVSRSNAIYKEQDGVEFVQSGQTVKYIFLPEQVVRLSTVADTFKVKTVELKLSFEQHALTVDESASSDQNLVDELELTLLYEDEKFPYHYVKQYSSENLIKRNPNALY